MIGYETDKQRIEKEMADYENLREVIAGILEEKKADKAKTA